MTKTYDMLLIKQLFSLLRAGLWDDHTPDAALFEGGDTDWMALYKLAQEQTVAAVLWDGIEKLPPELKPPKSISFNWYGYAVKVEQMNQIFSHKIARVFELYHDAGLKPILLKGTGVATYYRNPLRRGCGDIDIYVGKEEDYETANSILADVLGGVEVHDSQQMHRHDYHTTYTFSKGLIIENHKKFTSHFSPSIDRRFTAQLEAWYPAKSEVATIGESEIEIPPLAFNTQYVFIHMYRHLFATGIGLRQLCDWAVLINKLDGEPISLVGYKQGWRVMAGFLVEYLGVAPEKIPHFKRVYTAKNRIVLDMILDGGNFGKNLSHPRPKGYWAGKIFSFKRQISRWPKQMMISFTDTINYLYFCVIKEVTVYILELIEDKLTNKTK
ncbi:MAG: nucleotidyltransferase family protein [Rikenellaceae bacterium]